MAIQAAPVFDPNASYSPVAAGSPVVASAAPATGTAPVAAVSAAPSFDPNASYTPADQTASPAATGDSGILNKVGEFGAGIVPGMVEGMGETIQSLPWVGKKIISPESMQAEREYFKPGSAAEKAGQTAGVGLESVLEFVLGDEALKGLSIADKVGLAGKIADITTKNPYIGKLLQHGVHAARMGTVGTAEALAKGATPGEAVKTGVETGVGGEALSAAVEAVAPVVSKLRINPFRKTAQAVKEAVQGITAPPEVAGEAVSQPIAQTGVRATAPTVGSSFRSGIDVKAPLADAKALYKTVDDAAKTDFKALYDKLDAAHDAAREAGIGTPEEAKAELAIKNTQEAIDEAKKVAAQSGVRDVDSILAKADKKFTETQANKDFNKSFFGNSDVVQGNVAHGAPETINIDSAIKALERMDKPNRYGVSRLQQTTLGQKGAFKLKQVLYDAQKAGQTAMDSRALRNLILKLGGAAVGTALGVGYELSK